MKFSRQLGRNDRADSDKQYFPFDYTGKGGLLDLLPEQFSEVMVPRAVVEEILRGPEAWSGA